MTANRPAAPARDETPPSPCTQHCTLDEANVCLGCRRTLEEIVAWAGMTAAEKHEVLERVSHRQ